MQSGYLSSTLKTECSNKQVFKKFRLFFYFVEIFDDGTVRLKNIIWHLGYLW